MERLPETPIHPWLLAAYPPLAIAAANVGQVQSAHVFAAIGAALAAAAVVTLAFRALRYSWRHAALCSALTTVAFYTYGLASAHIEDNWITGDSRALFGFGAYATNILSALWIAAIVTGAYFIRRVPNAASVPVTGFLNLAGTFLVLAAAAGFVTAADPELSSANSDAPASRREDRTGGQHDIYYIILDGYARADVLQKHYGFDNAPFLDTLRAHGFSVDATTHANYYWTVLSLASSLNFDYLPNVLTSGDAWSEAYEKIRDSAASRFLKNRGYRFVHLQSTWGATSTNPHADEEIECSGAFANEYFRALVEISWLRAWHSSVRTDLAECHESNFKALGDLAARPGPKFVLAHFVLPHHPYLFDSSGRVLRNATRANQFQFSERLWEERSQYIEQLRFVNQRVSEAVARIVQESATPPIIILQSDHGPQLIDQLTFAERRRVRLANFAAYLLPGAPGLIPEGATPVNQFRYVFNHYFSAQLAILPPRHYFSRYGAPFEVTEVSDLLHRPSATGISP